MGRGGAIFCPRSELRNYWSDSQNSNDVRYIWRNCGGKPNVVDLDVTADVTGQVKVKMFDDFEYLDLSSTRVELNGNKSMQRQG